MSSLRALRNILLLFLLAAAIGGCSEKRNSVIFDPDIGHPGDWLGDHGPAAGEAQNDCTECHGADLRGGISGVSCFAAALDGVSCHGSGPGTRHTTNGWADVNLHGKAAKAAPGNLSGLAACKECHGGDFGGGTAQVSCATCHGIDAPHPAGNWRGGRVSHTSVHTANAAVCADCHRKPGARGAPGCFNNTLCHGQRGVHPSGWADPGRHGAEAKKNPGNSGFSDCQQCHGKDFSGGSSGVSCFTCHDINAPHPLRGWNNGGQKHTTTGEKNATVCADCHRESPGKAGCFNNTLCHGERGSPHPGGWADPNAHGAVAKLAPGGAAGFAYCESCHTNFVFCDSCHGSAAHPSGARWTTADPPTHRTTDGGNIGICANCHSEVAGSPDCFTSNGCH